MKTAEALFTLPLWTLLCQVPCTNFCSRHWESSNLLIKICMGIQKTKQKQPGYKFLPISNKSKHIFHAHCFLGSTKCCCEFKTPSQQAKKYSGELRQAIFSWTEKGNVKKLKTASKVFSSKLLLPAIFSKKILCNGILVVLKNVLSFSRKIQWAKSRLFAARPHPNSFTWSEK